MALGFLEGDELPQLRVGCSILNLLQRSHGVPSAVVTIKRTSGIVTWLVTLAY